MSDRVLRWGLLGTARINRAVIPPLRASERNALVAVASRTPDRAADYAAAWAIPRAHGSYEAMLADPDIDVVYIPLPNSLHAEWAVKAAEAGKHVLCEKPIALTPGEVDAIAAAARTYGVTIAEAFMYRHHPQTLMVKELVDSGVIGDLLVIRGAFTFSLVRPEDVRLLPVLGGGSIWDVGCYPISYARYIAGSEPEEVFGWHSLGPSGIDVVFAGQMRFPNDVLAQFDCGFRAPQRAALEIVGSKAVLSLSQPFKPGQAEQIILTRDDGQEGVPVPGQALYSGEIEDMADAILLGKQPRISLADSRGNVATIAALLESARESRPVRL